MYCIRCVVHLYKMFYTRCAVLSLKIMFMINWLHDCVNYSGCKFSIRQDCLYSIFSFIIANSFSRFAGSARRDRSARKQLWSRNSRRYSYSVSFLFYWNFVFPFNLLLFEFYHSRHSFLWPVIFSVFYFSIGKL